MRSVLFDLDGTLVDSLSTSFAAFNAAFTSQGGRERTIEEIIALFGPGEKEIFAKVVGEDRAEAAARAYSRFIEESLPRCPLHAGIPELLEQLKSDGVPLAVVTGRNFETAQMILRHHGLYDRFITVIANDHVKVSKPHPEGIHLALGRVKREAQHSLYIGDNWVDMRAGLDAGCRTIAALWDRGADRATLEKHGPHGYATRPAMILDFYEALS